MDVKAIAEQLRQARATGVPIDPISKRYGIDDPGLAYEIQSHNVALAEAEGREVVGCKIGLTSEFVQKQLGVSEPDFGVLWGDQAFTGGDKISIASYIQPRVEAEIAFVLGQDISDPNVTLEALMAAIDHTQSAVEIVDSAIADWKISLVDTIADNASAAAFVLGADHLPLSAVDLRLAGMVLSKNGQEVSLGVTAACMGNPLNATLWLAQKMISVGRPLRAGEIVLSGALGPMVDVVAGDNIKVEVQGFEPFSFEFVE